MVVAVISPPLKPNQDGKPQESTTARLLKAKRRAKQRED